jgi:hypothetical protein
LARGDDIGDSGFLISDFGFQISDWTERGGGAAAGFLREFSKYIFNREWTRIRKEWRDAYLSGYGVIVFLFAFIRGWFAGLEKGIFRTSFAFVILVFRFPRSAWVRIRRRR